MQGWRRCWQLLDRRQLALAADIVQQVQVCLASPLCVYWCGVVQGFKAEVAVTPGCFLELPAYDAVCLRAEACHHVHFGGSAAPGRACCASEGALRHALLLLHTTGQMS
jgi:hypothetical protein